MRHLWEWFHSFFSFLSTFLFRAQHQRHNKADVWDNRWVLMYEKKKKSRRIVLLALPWHMNEKKNIRYIWKRNLGWISLFLCLHTHVTIAIYTLCVKHFSFSFFFMMASCEIRFEYLHVMFFFSSFFFGVG